MNIDINRMTKIPETSYLSADKVELYRTIMRILYNEKEMYNALLSTNQILEKVKNVNIYSDLSEDELKSALNQLTDWGNLLPMQDPKRVATIEEYKNKVFKYSLTEFSIKIERMTIELENLFSDSNTLSSSLLVRIDDYLRDIDKIILEANLNETIDWWNNLQVDFTRLNQNYSDYLHMFYSASGEKLIRSIDFIQHKDKFVDYLRHFIRFIQKYSSIIEKTLLSIDEGKTFLLIDKIIVSEQSLPHTTADSVNPDDMRAKICGQWAALTNWFVSNDLRSSVCSMAMEYTNEIIRKILSNAVMLMQLQNSGISRKNDYKKYMIMFSKCKTLSEAHCLSAHVFGSMNVSHYKYITDKETDSIFENAVDLQPQQFEIQPKAKVYKPKIRTSGFCSNQLQKALQREKRLEKIRQEQKMIESYIIDRQIRMSDLSESIIPEELRTTLLKWISSANQNKNKSGITDFGMRFHILKSDTQTVLHCNDGDLYMPSYTIVFEEEQNG